MRPWPKYICSRLCVTFSLRTRPHFAQASRPLATPWLFAVVTPLTLPSSFVLAHLPTQGRASVEWYANFILSVVCTSGSRCMACAQTAGKHSVTWNKATFSSTRPCDLTASENAASARMGLPELGA
ncbi:uncharacterized protein SCHCODRAFT_02484073 [Schizophyllum commune H4-8]|uniref:Expressed protein n=1 Tax=Schizophyllum commune (strain H4-8 / FGSC 9210) TaxID=578458 RepID=D8PWF1_SCHCM|nr:uncharacterized protein SCHCODRAFT_02484073 [Schizophyllum commune H4-8]KAI5899975.1 hypothetical protein SCHCODRAFT_02484073 [Schizophyllum commune H4-8]